MDERFDVGDLETEDQGAGPSQTRSLSPGNDSEEEYGYDEDVLDGLDPQGFAASDKIVKPLTPEALAAFKAAQEKAGVIYISRIPPGMRPPKVKHLMSAYGEVGRVYLQQEDAKRAHLRKKYTATKKAHFTEGWVEFKDKRVARSVAQMLNAQPIGGKKGTRWRDDVWTMKYLPKFKWNMLTEQITHEAAIRTAKLRMELEQSRKEQKDYLRQVELARVLDKRVERKRKAAEARGEELGEDEARALLRKANHDESHKKDEQPEKKRKKDTRRMPDHEKDKSNLESVLHNIF